MVHNCKGFIGGGFETDQNCFCWSLDYCGFLGSKKANTRTLTSLGSLSIDHVIAGLNAPICPFTDYVENMPGSESQDAGKIYQGHRVSLDWSYDC